MDGRVHVISSKSQWDGLLQGAASKGQTVAVDFSATWCQPCKMMAPVFRQLAEQYPDVVFLKVEVDMNEALAAEYAVTAMPTFAIIQEGQRVGEVIGADKNKLADLIARWSSHGQQQPARV
ncbi:hypothetical protein WJX84_012213 [Apatococcus fuscideae]|uniref:Thioredoxin domain-containing protein n=1 Tax=Apatococcus fuscideae TaxID=2026836 RepID=A0AAW1SQK4_9CHLO